MTPQASAFLVARLAALVSLGAGLAACGNGGGTWEPPVRIGAGTACFTSGRIPALRGPDPHIAFDGAGNGLAVWTQCDGARMNIRAARFAGGHWEESRSIGTNSSDALPRVGLSPAGNGLAVWWAAGANWASVFDRSAGWGVPQPIDGGFAGGTELMVDAQGGATTVWLSLVQGSGATLSARRFDPASGWTAPRTVAIETVVGPAVKVAGDARGDAVALWTRADERGRPFVWSARYDVETGWDIPRQIEADGMGATGASTPDLAVAPDGRAVAVWAEFGGTVAAARFTPGTGWGTPGTVAGGVDDPASLARVALDARGNALVVWLTHNFHRIGSRRLRADGGMDAPLPLGQGDSPLVVADAAGNGTAVWRELNPDGFPAGLLASRSQAGGTWDGPVRLRGPVSPSTGGGSDPAQLAVDRSGNVFALWMQLADGVGTVEVWSDRFVADR